MLLWFELVLCDVSSANTINTVTRHTLSHACMSNQIDQFIYAYIDAKE
uniref:Uncharacterized protein n=1 Tax=Arundo donax TaxID=35708 RepID=A0A0A9FH39_ARUDO